MAETYDINKAREAQRKYCEEKGYPHFAPVSGRCWSCGHNIYTQVEHKRVDWKTGGEVKPYITGISVEKAGEYLITGCPHCHRTYCD